MAVLDLPAYCLFPTSPSLTTGLQNKQVVDVFMSPMSSGKLRLIHAPDPPLRAREDVQGVPAALAVPSYFVPSSW